MLVKIYPENPNLKQVAQVADILRQGGVIIYPTDGVYAFGCSIRSPKAVEKMRNLTGKKVFGFTIMCADLSHISDFARVDNHQFRILKRNLPGPFTFVLNACSKVPEKVLGKRKTIGIRVAGNSIPIEIVRELGEPLVTCSVKSPEEDTAYITDPELICESWGAQVDAVVDGGFGGLTPTTVVDLTQDDPEIIRQGIGELVL